MATRSDNDELGVALYAFGDGEVGGGIAGVEGNEHVDFVVGESIDVLGAEAKIGAKLERFGNFVAFGGEFFAQLNAEHIQAVGEFVLPMREECEGEIAFAAAHIDHVQSGFGIEFGEIGIHDFDIFIDLSIFILACGVYFAIVATDAEILQKRCVFGYEIIFLLVVCRRGRGDLRSGTMLELVVFALPSAVLGSGEEVGDAEVLGQLEAQKIECFGEFEILDFIAARMAKRERKHWALANQDAFGVNIF